MRTTRAGRRAASLCFFALAALVACQPPAKPDLLLIVIDTLRADRLGCYGSPRGLTPFIDSLAARGHLFRHAYAQTSWTNPSIASLLTSRYQSQHGVIAFNSVLPESELTLPEVLHGAGYTTGGFSANGLIGPTLGFGQGYDVYSAHWVQQSEEPTFLWVPERADMINREALEWVDYLWQSGHPAMPVFLYLQYMEPHTPYAPPDAALDRVRAGRPRPDLRQVNEHAYLGNVVGVPADILQDIVDVYDAEVISIDAALRNLFAELSRRGFLEHAIVVITADHGEELKDHGLLGHEKTLYNEVIRVPLIVLTPRQTKGVVIDRVVSLVDVAPTLAEAAGLPVPATFEGTSHARELLWPGILRRLRRAMAVSYAAEPSVAYSELIKPADDRSRRFSPHERSVVVGETKLILGVGGEREFYRLDSDPGERDANGVGDAERALLEARLQAVQAHSQQARSASETKALDEQTRERLRALGYAN